MPDEDEGFEPEAVAVPRPRKVSWETAGGTAASMGEGHAACDAWIARLGAEVMRLREALAEKDGELAALRGGVT